MERNDVEESLLLNQEGNENTKETVTWGVICEELKKLSYVAGPMAVVNLSQFLIQVTSIMIVGHLGELALSSTAIAISIANVTGFSFLLGMACALETLCGQAYGAGQYKKLGTQTYTAIFSLIIVSILLSILWINMEQMLVSIGQDPLISSEAGRFIIFLIPALFANAFLQPLLRYFQMQSMVLPMFISSFCAFCFHIPICWALVFKSGLDHTGAAIAMGLSYWLNVIILALYMKFSSSCEKTRSPISMEIFQVKEFFWLAIPSAVMICLEWWSYELVTLFSGLLPNPQLETSVLSVSLNMIIALYSIPYGVSAAVSTRVSNELGAGNSQKARISVVTAVLVAFILMIVVNLTLFASRNVFGYVFSNEKEVVDYVADMIPLLSIVIITDNILGVLSGVVRGCGWQHLGAYINLAAFYVFGIPLSVTLGFIVKLGGKGLWIGIISGATVQTILLSIITFCTNWEKQVIKAKERLVQEKPHISVA